MKKKRTVALSKLHLDILAWLKKRTDRHTTPDDLARKWNGGKVTRDTQQWAYLQLARLMNRGCVRRTLRGRYYITAVGLRKLDTKKKAA